MNMKPTPDDLSALFREGADAAPCEPPTALDRRILDAARAEVRDDRPRESKETPGRVPWWRHWMMAASSLAVAVLGVSVAWRVVVEEDRVRSEAAQAVQEIEAVSPSAPAQALAPTGEAGEKRTAPRRAFEPPKVSLPNKALPASKARTVPAPSAPSETARSDVSPAKVLPASPPAAAVQSSPSPAAEAMTAARPAARASADSMAAKALVRSAASAPGAGALTGAADSAADDAPTPEAWVRYIRELRASGRQAEADRSLARLRERYPDFALPEELMPQ